jgi:DNA-binding response OmpR family regulator
MRILLVEDERDLGAAIETALVRDKYIVDWVQDGLEAWDYLDSQASVYTVVILDWMLPGLSGVELCRRLRSRKSALPILILTARDQMNDRVTGLDAGADDYLTKPFGMSELRARLRALQRRSPQLQPTQLRVGQFVLDYGTRTVYHETIEAKPEAIPLTTKEFQLLEYFMERPEQIITSDQLMHYLWEVSSEPSSNVVAAQIRLLRRKLAQVQATSLIETVYGMGYRFNLPHATQ